MDELTRRTGLTYEAYTDNQKDGKWIGWVIPWTPWNGSEPVEVEILARRMCLHAIVGRCSAGYYLCIPDLFLGTDLSGLKDVYWNREKLLSSHSMNEIDASSIACALAAIEELFEAD